MDKFYENPFEDEFSATEGDSINLIRDNYDSFSFDDNNDSHNLDNEPSEFPTLSIQTLPSSKGWDNENNSSFSESSIEKNENVHENNEEHDSKKESEINDHEINEEINGSISMIVACKSNCDYDEEVNLIDSMVNYALYKSEDKKEILSELNSVISSLNADNSFRVEKRSFIHEFNNIIRSVNGDFSDLEDELILCEDKYLTSFKKFNFYKLEDFRNDVYNILQQAQQRSEFIASEENDDSAENKKLESKIIDDKKVEKDKLDDFKKEILQSYHEASNDQANLNKKSTPEVLSNKYVLNKNEKIEEFGGYFEGDKDIDNVISYNSKKSYITSDSLKNSFDYNTEQTQRTIREELNNKKNIERNEKLNIKIDELNDRKLTEETIDKNLYSEITESNNHQNDENDFAYHDIKYDNRYQDESLKSSIKEKENVISNQANIEREKYFNKVINELKEEENILDKNDITQVTKIEQGYNNADYNKNTNVLFELINDKEKDIEIKKENDERSVMRDFFTPDKLKQINNLSNKESFLRNDNVKRESFEEFDIDYNENESEKTRVAFYEDRSLEQNRINRNESFSINDRKNEINNYIDKFDSFEKSKNDYFSEDKKIPIEQVRNKEDEIKEGFFTPQSISEGYEQEHILRERRDNKKINNFDNQKEDNLKMSNKFSFFNENIDLNNKPENYLSEQKKIEEEFAKIDQEVKNSSFYLKNENNESRTDLNKELDELSINNNLLKSFGIELNQEVLNYLTEQSFNELPLELKDIYDNHEENNDMLFTDYQWLKYYIWLYSLVEDKNNNIKIVDLFFNNSIETHTWNEEMKRLKCEIQFRSKRALQENKFILSDQYILFVLIQLTYYFKSYILDYNIYQEDNNIFFVFSAYSEEDKKVEKYLFIDKRNDKSYLYDFFVNIKKCSNLLWLDF